MFCARFRNMCLLDSCPLGKYSHFCPPAFLVPTSFGRHSKKSFPSQTTQNDLKTRNETQTTGTRTERAGGQASFGISSQLFGPPSPNTVGRSDCVPVVPSNEDLVSFLLVRKWNDPATRDIFVFGSFHREKSVMSLGMKRHRNDNETTLGWYWSDYKTMQECIVLNVLGPAIWIRSWSALSLFLFQPKLSLFCKFQSVVWWKPRVFAQVGSTLTFSLTICTALLGNSLLQRSSSITKLVFRAIQNSSPNFLFFLPPQYLSLSSKPSA